MSAENFINDVRIIAGMLREALFYSRRISLENDELKFEALITDIEEQSTRSISEQKFCMLTPLVSSDRIEEVSKFTFRCSFPQFIIQWDSKIEKMDDGQIKVAIPTCASVLNQRSSLRVSPAKSDVVGGPVLVQTEGLHGKAYFELEDFSQNGLGGKLSSTSGLPIMIGTKLYGKIRNQNGTINVSGKIVQIQIQSQSRDKFGEASYRIGIALNDRNRRIPLDPNGELAAANLKERRRAKRVSASMELSLTSPLNSGHEIALNIVDASTTGFSARLQDSSDINAMLVGATYPLVDSSLCVELVASADKCLHFQFVTGKSEDSLNWLKQLSKFYGRNFSNRIALGSELVHLFCNSGALSSEYAKGQAKIADEFSNSFSIDVAQPPWIHRWIERTSEGDIKGHVSAARFGDSLWHLGDISGMVEESKKISRDFIPAFFTNFKEYCLSISPCPHLLITWFDGHPYWAAFEAYLKSRGKNRVRCRVRTRYHRMPRGTAASIENVGSINVQKLSAKQYDLIETLQAEIHSPEALQLLKSFDFDSRTFGSRSLQVAIASAGGEFRREYYLIENEESRFLIIFHQFPLGTSALRTEDVPWIFPLGLTNINSINWERLHLQVWTLALKEGFEFPGILDVVPYEQTEISKATKTLIWTLSHPDAFEFFENYEAK